MTENMRDAGMATGATSEEILVAGARALAFTQVCDWAAEHVKTKPGMDTATLIGDMFLEALTAQTTHQKMGGKRDSR